MKVGFTGSSKRVTPEQRQNMRGLLTAEWIDELHHGDCVEADAEADAIAAEAGIKRIAHPPSNPKARAFCKAEVVCPAAPYLERNRDIVRETEWLVAVPDTPVGQERVRSGTWATIRYARERRRPITILWPDGTITIEGDTK